MSDHPAWCQPAACTAHRGPAPSLRRAHRSDIMSVDVVRGAITTMLIQDIDGSDPRLVVTAKGYAHSRMVELGTAGIHALIMTLSEQLAAAETTINGRRPVRPAESITDRASA